MIIIFEKRMCSHLCPKRKTTSIINHETGFVGVIICETGMCSYICIRKFVPVGDLGNVHKSQYPTLGKFMFTGYWTSAELHSYKSMLLLHPIQMYIYGFVSFLWPLEQIPCVYFLTPDQISFPICKKAITTSINQRWPLLSDENVFIQCFVGKRV